MFVNADESSPRVHDLARACAEAYKAGGSQLAATPDLDEKFNVQLLVSMLLRISVSEIVAILEASQFRTRALRLSRAGRVDDANAALDIARSIVTAAELSDEAALANRSFQTAAAAYLKYRAHDHAAAEASLLEALDCCRTLREQFDYAMESRRIHLVRHIVRVRSAAGRPAEALDVAWRMIRYLDGDIASWPFPRVALSAGPDALPIGDRLLLLDQIVSEMSPLPASAATSAMLAQSDSAPFGPGLPRTEALRRGYLRVAAIRARAENDLIAFLMSATEFFRGGPADMPRAWRDMSREFLTVCRRIAPDVAIAVEEEHELSAQLPPLRYPPLATHGSDPLSGF
jgi:hypothetical protein